MSHNAKLDRLSMDAVPRANSGHPGTAMAMAPVVLHTHFPRTGQGARADQHANRGS